MWPGSFACSDPWEATWQHVPPSPTSYLVEDILAQRQRNALSEAVGRLVELDASCPVVEAACDHDVARPGVRPAE